MFVIQLAGVWKGAMNGAIGVSKIPCIIGSDLELLPGFLAHLYFSGKGARFWVKLPPDYLQSHSIRGLG